MVLLPFIIHRVHGCIAAVSRSTLCYERLENERGGVLVGISEVS